jgi:ATP-dependent DNA helicase RecQ
VDHAVGAHQALRDYFGFQEFREGQFEIIEFVLAGHDAVVVMPTGGGKSLCFQLPAMIKTGVTLVVSPLIALMKDQVDQLTARGIPTTFINSSLGFGELRKRLSQIRMGRYKLVYVAPERFRSEAFADAIREVQVELFAVDEAHCISHWGHDFRPDYLKLKDAIEKLRRPQVLALTATATPHVRADIAEQLGLKDPRVFVAGFDRPNLALQVRHVSSEKEKMTELKGLILEVAGSGIVYAATRKGVEQISAKLKMAGLRVDPYHGGMRDQERESIQDGFMQGRSRAIVATNAFGMGIDKPDIRFVVHYHIPGSIEAYYQEIGRAGRDGLASTCLLLFNYADTRTQQFFIDGNHPSPELIRSVYRELASIGADSVELSARELAARIGVKNEMAVNSALLFLERSGHIERGRSGDGSLLCWLARPIDQALEALADDTAQAVVLRELIFNYELNEREPTEIVASEVSARLAVHPAQFRRAIGLLATQGLIRYGNAYSGRGIRLVDVHAGQQPRIDQRELASRAAAEQWKLRKMVDYCYHEKCLRRFILNYFGDRKQFETCGTCSSCSSRAGHAGDTRTAKAERLAVSGPGNRRAAAIRPSARPTPMDRFIIEEAPSGKALRAALRSAAKIADEMNPRDGSERDDEAIGRAITADEVVVVKKVLSCVARLNGRFGKGVIAAVLRGASTKQVAEHKLDRLSTYGLLRQMPQSKVAAFVKALIEARCLVVRSGAYPTVELTAFGREVMTGRAEVTLDLP